MRDDTDLKTILVEILYQVESTNDVVRNWERQRIQARDIIQNALCADIHLETPPNYRTVLGRLADVLNVAILPSLQDVIDRESRERCSESRV